MKRNLTILSMAAMLLAAITADAQTTNVLEQDITWTTSSSEDLVSGDTVMRQMKFTSYGAEKIEHHGRNNVVQTFEVTSVSGTWSDISQPGTLTYQVTIVGNTGVIVLEKNGQGTFLTIDMSGSADGGIRRKFTISSYQLND